jgi:hypothetical protein
MEYITNISQEEFSIIMFNYMNRNWEIMKDFKDELDIQESIQRRIYELDAEAIVNGSFYYSDLIVDYIEKNNDNQWQQEL